MLVSAPPTRMTVGSSPGGPPAPLSTSTSTVPTGSSSAGVSSVARVLKVPLPPVR